MEKRAVVEPFELYTPSPHLPNPLGTPHMDPWTLAYLAGHRDMNTTKRYVHPQQRTIQDAMSRARAEETSTQSGHKSGHSEATQGKSKCTDVRLNQ